MQNHFGTATVLFYEGRYEEALMAINQFIAIKPSNSLAFNNRALINFSRGHLSSAKEDIATALQLNHLNYVAYFNLFSVYTRQNELKQALLALRGALSCLCLIKGRLLKNKDLMTKALHYSPDNLDALLLLVLLQVQEQNYQQALLYVEVYESLNTKERILQKLRALIKELQSHYSDQLEEALYDYLLEAPSSRSKLSGKTVEPQTQKVDGEDLKPIIEAGIKEFNQLYSDINQKVGGAAYLIAKTGQLEQSLAGNRSKHEHHQLIKKNEILASS